MKKSLPFHNIWLLGGGWLGSSITKLSQGEIYVPNVNAPWASATVAHLGKIVISLLKLGMDHWLFGCALSDQKNYSWKRYKIIYYKLFCVAAPLNVFHLGWCLIPLYFGAFTVLIIELGDVVNIVKIYSTL